MQNTSEQSILPPTQAQTQAQQVAGGIRRLRQQLETLDQDIASMITSELALADRLGWTHPSVEQLHAEIDVWQARQQRLMGALRGLLDAQAALIATLVPRSA